MWYTIFKQFFPGDVLENVPYCRQWLYLCPLRLGWLALKHIFVCLGVWLVGGLFVFFFCCNSVYVCTYMYKYSQEIKRGCQFPRRYTYWDRNVFYFRFLGCLLGLLTLGAVFVCLCFILFSIHSVCTFLGPLSVFFFCCCSIMVIQIPQAESFLSAVKH